MVSVIKTDTQQMQNPLSQRFTIFFYYNSVAISLFYVNIYKKNTSLLVAPTSLYIVQVYMFYFWISKFVTNKFVTLQ